MGDSAFAAALAKAQQLAAPQTPDPNAPDLGLTAGVPTPPPPSLDDAVQKALQLAALQGADTSSGAPSLVRAAVGAAAPQDRLATLQQWYPDAQPVPGTDNFVFTPAGGKRQTYMPIGWRLPSWGDIASLGGEAAEGAGALGGAALASPSGPVGVAVGGGLGAAAGKEAFQDLMRFYGMQDTRTPVQRAADVATTAGINTVLPVVGERVAGPMISSLLRPEAPTATQTAARQLDLSGVTSGLESGLPPSVAAESAPWSKVEQPVLSMPFTGGLRETYTGTRAGLATGVENVAGRAAGGQPVPPADTFGTNINNIARNIDTTWQANREAADNAATGLIGADRPVDLTPLRDLRTDLQTKLGAAPLSLAPRYQAALDQVNQVLADATKTGSDTLPYSAVSKIRTDVGKAIDWQSSPVSGVSPTGVPAMQDVYGALKDTLTGAAKDAGPQAEAALQAHDAMVDAYRATGGPADTFKQLADPATRSDAIARLMQNPSQQSQTALANLMHYATPAQRQELAAGTIQQMGTIPSDKDAGFDMGRWMSNYKSMTQPAKDAMFGPGGVQGSLQTDLDNLATVQRSMGASAANKNFSNTSPTFWVTAALSGLGTAAAAGSLKGLAAAAAPLVAPSAAGKLLTSQPFVKWLTGTWGVNGLQASQWGAHLGRLAAVTAADPSVANEVAQLRTQLPQQLPAQ